MSTSKDSSPDFGVVRVAHIFCFLCCVVFVVVMGLVYPMLPVSLDCPFGFLLRLFFNIHMTTVAI